MKKEKPKTICVGDIILELQADGSYRPIRQLTQKELEEVEQVLMEYFKIK